MRLPMTPLFDCWYGCRNPFKRGKGFLVMTKKPTIKKSHMLPWEDADDYETPVGRRGQGSALGVEARE